MASAQCRAAPACASCQVSQARCEALGCVPPAGPGRKAPPGARSSPRATSSPPRWLTARESGHGRETQASGEWRRRRFGEVGRSSRTSARRCGPLVLPGDLGRCFGSSGRLGLGTEPARETEREVSEGLRAALGDPFPRSQSPSRRRLPLPSIPHPSAARLRAPSSWPLPASWGLRCPVRGALLSARSNLKHISSGATGGPGSWRTEGFLGPLGAPHSPLPFPGPCALLPTPPSSQPLNLPPLRSWGRRALLDSGLSWPLSPAGAGGGLAFRPRFPVSLPGLRGEPSGLLHRLCLDAEASRLCPLKAAGEEEVDSEWAMTRPQTAAGGLQGPSSQSDLKAGMALLPGAPPPPPLSPAAQDLQAPLPGSLPVS